MLPLYTGDRGVTVATNVETKIVIHAFLREITRMPLLITGGFLDRPIPRRHFLIARCKGPCHVNQILAKTCKNLTMMAITSVVYATYQCRVWFWDRFQLSAISEFICDTPVHKGRMGVTTATNFGTKIAINAFLRETTRMWLLRGFSWSANPKKTFLTARV